MSQMSDEEFLDELGKLATTTSKYNIPLHITPDDVARSLNDPTAQGYVLADCGHYTKWPMSASLGSACPDCYDRMSDGAYDY